MAHTKNKTEILDNIIKKSEINEHYLGWDDDYYWDDYDYDPYYCCEYCTPREPRGGLDYEYDMSRSNKDGKMVDLDSISVERKRESRINSVLGEDGKTRIGDFVNEKL